VTAVVRYRTPTGRWVITATVLGSGIAFLDGTVVNVALPSIGKDLGAGITGLQWILDGYLVTLGALLLLGGSLGDLYGRRRMFVAGLGWFTVFSLCCGAAPNTGFLIVSRALQGVGAALLVPGSLAIISASFAPSDRSRAVGAWSGLAGVATAIGPFVGGWLIDAVSWRLIFLLNVPLAAVAVWITLRHVPESRGAPSTHGPDVPGAVTASVGLALLAYGLIERRWWVAVAGGLVLALFVALERRRPEPMVPPSLFRSRQFTGANLTTFAVYAALGGAMFLVVLQLQANLGYSALEAGGALLPVTILMLTLSARAGALAQRIGPRLPMTVGPLAVATGMLLFQRVKPGTTYAGSVLPAAVLLGLGLSITVAPLTAAVLAAVEERHLGVGSAVNNAVARVAGLIAVAVLPVLAGIRGAASTAALEHGFGRAMVACAIVAAAGGVLAFATVREATPVQATRQADLFHPCHDPCRAEGSAA
jgi:EmrB/QacA subfamily drug resistance transporter